MLKDRVSKLAGAVVDLLFPMQCAGCRREGSLICDSCAATLPRLNKPYCSFCASPNSLSPCRWCRETPPALDGLRAPYLFQGTLREAIEVFKYRGVSAAAPELGRLLAAYLVDYRADNPLPGRVIVPAPLHPRRLRRRGYNQSALLARELAKVTGLDLDEGLLTRTKQAAPQVGASRSQRRENVRDSFACSRSASGLSVLLVDDVATTGSTLSACAAALKASGAAAVWGLTLARES